MSSQAYLDEQDERGVGHRDAADSRLKQGQDGDDGLFL